MPAPREDINREAVATSIALHGYRETARRTGISLGTVQRIGKAAGVKAPDPLMRLTPITAVQRTDTPISLQSGAIHVGTPSHAIATDALADKGARSRLASAHIGCTALETIAEGMDAEPEKSLVLLDSALTAGKLLQTANVPGWERQQQPSSGVSLLVHGNAQVLVQGPTAPE